MTENKKKPVEIFDVKNSYGLFQIAHVGENEYYLYQTYSPWYGFLNFIPNVGNKRKAQEIDRYTAENNMFRKDRKYFQENNSFRIGSAMLLGALIPSLKITPEPDMIGLYSIISLGPIFLWLALRYYRLYLATLKNKMIADYKPNRVIKLYSSFLFGRLIALLVFALVLIPNKKFQLFAITLASYNLIPIIYFIFPDIKNLSDTQNRIKIISEINSENVNKMHESQ